MKIIIDNKIPYIKEAVQRIADEVVYAPGKDFTPELVRDADALIVRTRTHCNRDLLEGSRVKFIATATIGFDHIDTEYCKQAGIEWTNAPGCNSASVAQYIQSSLLVWKSVRNKRLEKTFIGTPHIAGYSADGKANATRMSLDAICNFFQIKGDYEINAPALVSPIIHAKNHEEAVLQMYNPTEDSNRLKNQPELFETLRGDYPLRREEKAYIIKY